MIDDLKEFYSGRNCYDMVMDFHKAFGHEYCVPGEPYKRLSMANRVTRCKWMAEEVMEYISAGNADQIEQVDSLVDLLYFILGTYVIAGLDPYNDSRLNGVHGDMAGYGRQMATELYEAGNGYAPADRLYMGSPMEWRTHDGERAIELIFNYALEGNTIKQLIALREILDWTLVQFAMVGADPYPYFVIVHDANMGKLWPDGKPRYGADRKILKPDGYEPPQKEMANLMLNDLDREIEDDSVPF